MEYYRKSENLETVSKNKILLVINVKFAVRITHTLALLTLVHKNITYTYSMNTM